MVFSKTQLEKLLVKSFNVDIKATLERDIPSVGTDLTVSALEEMLIIHSNTTDRATSALVYISPADIANPVEQLPLALQILHLAIGD